jgi:hypothetical protein
MKNAILGTIALTPRPEHRHMFSGRTVMGGRTTLYHGTVTTVFGESDTPPIMYDIRLGDADHAWLAMLAEKLESIEKVHRRHVHALEYFYRAWALDPIERFPVLCMALDAIFGDANQATQAVVDGVRETIGSQVSAERLRDLMKLRAAVIHGGAPDVYESRTYEAYYREYGDDPIGDLELVVARCLSQRVFAGQLKEHPDPNAETIAEGQRLGRLPRSRKQSSILGAAEYEGYPTG